LVKIGSRRLDRGRAERGISVESLREIAAAEEFAGAACSTSAAVRPVVTRGGRMRARDLFGVDLDPQSVAAARTLFQRLGRLGPDRMRRSSISTPPGTAVDIVHSWGVLHHTGDMWRAVDCAARMVKPQAISSWRFIGERHSVPYGRSEKRFYAHAPKPLQRYTEALHSRQVGLFGAATQPRALIGLSLEARHGLASRRARLARRLAISSATPEEIVSFMKQRGFTKFRSFTHAAVAGGYSGSHCDELFLLVVDDTVAWQKLGLIFKPGRDAAGRRSRRAADDRRV